ncbi:Hypothetical predicted protein [Olea europaea subsp. europaea]|uniref:Uncharacterized protein n=1 Tax=Olea europaea subsp. europaea TaxID=158383 RepID=A0A8S0USR8_OLEEU|nr:Hypothetical predicted protein [Olea europaea subsp. europaea]
MMKTKKGITYLYRRFLKNKWKEVIAAIFKPVLVLCNAAVILDRRDDLSTAAMVIGVPILSCVARGVSSGAITMSIETELLERLKKGVYGDIYNYPVDKYNEILDKEVIKDMLLEPEIEYVEGYEELEEDGMEDFGGLAISNMDDDNDNNDDNEETVAVERKGARKGSMRKMEKEPTDK